MRRMTGIMERRTVSQDGAVRFKTNNEGGVLGGITNGEDIVMRVREGDSDHNHRSGSLDMSP